MREAQKLAASTGSAISISAIASFIGLCCIGPSVPCRPPARRRAQVSVPALDHGFMPVMQPRTLMTQPHRQSRDRFQRSILRVGGDRIATARARPQ